MKTSLKTLSATILAAIFLAPSTAVSVVNENHKDMIIAGDIAFMQANK